MSRRPQIDLYELEGRIDCDQPPGESPRCYVSPEISPAELTALVTLARAGHAGCRAVYGRDPVVNEYEIVDTAPRAQR